jgi:formylmethanofuran--tetrahydromethanopterin N-formyltransferase
LGKNLRYFGDGFQSSTLIDGKRLWRVPVMDGEFLCEETTGMVKAVGGGNFLILAESQAQALSAGEAAIEAMRKVNNVIMPFPGGIVRSGSKVGSKYKTLMASTNDAFCPTIRGITRSELSEGIGAALEIVIDGLADSDVRNAMRAGISAVCGRGVRNGIRRITAGNYGGKLGQFHFHLHQIMS